MKYDEIPGWFDFQDIYDAAVERAPSDLPSRFLELGSFLGQSTAYLASKIKESGKPIGLYAVDLWRLDPSNDHNKYIKKFGSDIYPQFLNNMEACGVIDIVASVQASTSDAALGFRSKSLEFDFIFVDACHEYDGVFSDLSNYWPLLRAGGQMAGHDIYMDGVRRAVDNYFGSLSLNNKLQFTPSCWMINKNNK